MQNCVIESDEYPFDRRLADSIRERLQFRWCFITQFGKIILRDCPTVPDDIFVKHYTLARYSHKPDGTYFLAHERKKYTSSELIEIFLAHRNDLGYWIDIFCYGNPLRVVQIGGADKLATN